MHYDLQDHDLKSPLFPADRKSPDSLNNLINGLLYMDKLLYDRLPLEVNRMTTWSTKKSVQKNASW